MDRDALAVPIVIVGLWICVGGWMTLGYYIGGVEVAYEAGVVFGTFAAAVTGFLVLSAARAYISAPASAASGDS